MHRLCNFSQALAKYISLLTQLPRMPWCRHYPTEFLNSLTLSGLPPHDMELKVGYPVMLLQNLCAGPRNGLCNGTGMIILQLGDQVIEVEIASGVNKGKYVLIPCITLIPSDSEFPFTLKRRQCPIGPCISMSANKAQGQTHDFVGVYLPNNVFSHGQLYVALSRVHKSSSLAILLNNMESYTRNIVYLRFLTSNV